MSGTATLTIVEDMIEAIMPTITVSRTSQRKPGPWRIRRCSMVVGEVVRSRVVMWVC